MQEIKIRARATSKQPLQKQPEEKPIKLARYADYKQFSNHENSINIFTTTRKYAPVWFGDTDYILHGYRRQTNSFRGCILSLTYLHNETGNVYTHLIGLLTIFPLIYFTFFQWMTSESTSIYDYLALTPFFIGSIACLGCSTVFHLFTCHSRHVSVGCNKADYVGIVFLQVGSFVPCLYYGFYCDSFYRTLYLAAISVCGAFTIYITLGHKYATPQYRWLRTGVFTLLGSLGVVPLFHHVWRYGVNMAFESFAVEYVLIMGASYLGGAFIYAYRIPERWIPYAFDIFGHSHQIWHLCVYSGNLENDALKGGQLLTELTFGNTEDTALLIDTKQETIRRFLSNILEPVEKALEVKSGTQTERGHPRTPKYMGRWEAFKSDAANYSYPNTRIGNDVKLPGTSTVEIGSEKDVDTIIHNHLHNFNRIFRDEGRNCKFVTKAQAFTENPSEGNNCVKFIGKPDFLLTFGPKVVSFIEDKSPDTLPVQKNENELFDLIEMYRKDRKYDKSSNTRPELKRKEVFTVIKQVYGYLAFNNLKYGCVTCYDVTYFLHRPSEGRLLISDAIYHYSTSPTLLQSIYYFIRLVVGNNSNGIESSPNDGAMPYTEFDDDVESSSDESNSQEHMEIDDSQEKSDNCSNYSTDMNVKLKRYHLDINALRNGTFVGSGATGSAIRLKDTNIVVKCCDTFNNRDGYQMLKNEIKIYRKLSNYKLKCVPKYYGECEYFGQHFIAMDFIQGKHCDWRGDDVLKKKLGEAVKELKSVGVVHDDLRPENVILTAEGDIKLIDFGVAKMI
ncbi:Adiponectin receptor protein 1 [Terramyces sp. JEL0728]|nr:Adiponectin receptor protein 1 [Terramyces sp. JEL0728]